MWDGGEKEGMGREGKRWGWGMGRKEEEEEMENVEKGRWEVGQAKYPMKYPVSWFAA